MTAGVGSGSDSVYGGLLAADGTRWAFGSDFADPLSGLDTRVPDGVDGPPLAAYSLGLADDALIAAQRLSWWCSRAPELELDLAWANVALDLLGQARLLLARAAAADPGLVPELPAGSPVPADDALAFFRDGPGFRHHRLVEGADPDFGFAVVRLLLLATGRLATMEALRASRDPVLAGVAGKAVPELAYHRDLAARWFVVLAQGTGESRRRVLVALERLWPLHLETLCTHPVEAAAAAAGVGVDPATLAGPVGAVLDEVLAAAGVARPEGRPSAGLGARTGRDGVHTEALGPLLAEMQSVARAHPLGRW